MLNNYELTCALKQSNKRYSSRQSLSVDKAKNLQIECQKPTKIGT
jgi:hypothetical protein